MSPELASYELPGFGSEQVYRQQYGGKIFRRVLYPATEENLIKENYLGAVARQDDNTCLTPIWLDKQ